MTDALSAGLRDQQRNKSFTEVSLWLRMFALYEKKATYREQALAAAEAYDAIPGRRSFSLKKQVSCQLSLLAIFDPHAWVKIGLQWYEDNQSFFMLDSHHEEAQKIDFWATREGYEFFREKAPFDKQALLVRYDRFGNNLLPDNYDLYSRIHAQLVLMKRDRDPSVFVALVYTYGRVELFTFS